MSKNEMIVIDPKEFGLEQKQAKGIENHFAPMVAEREGLLSVYEELIKKELTKELSIEASTLRKRFMKVRISIAAIHKTEKEYYLATGRYVDAIKNRHTKPIEEMESRLREIEKHWENQEKQRIQKIQESRSEEIEKYIEDVSLIPPNLGEMDDSIWENYLAGTKAQHEARLEKERIQKEKEEKEELAKILHSERTLKIAEFSRWIPKETDTDLSNLSQEQFDELYEYCQHEEEQDLKEQEEIRIENERLKEEARVREEKAEKERKTFEKKAKEEAEKAEAKLKKEQEEAKKIQDKLDRVAAEAKAKEEAEAKAKEEAEKAKREAEMKLKAAPDKEKLAVIQVKIATLQSEILQFTAATEKGEKVFMNINDLLEKVYNYADTQKKGL